MFLKFYYVCFIVFIVYIQEFGNKLEGSPASTVDGKKQGTKAPPKPDAAVKKGVKADVVAPLAKKLKPEDVNYLCQVKLLLAKVPISTLIVIRR